MKHAEPHAEPQKRLPVIDIAPLVARQRQHAAASGSGADAAAVAHVAQQIRAACIEWGFFYITHTGLDFPEMIKKTKELFDLPAASKEAMAASLSPLHRGWTGVGGAHNCSDAGEAGPDLKESFLLGAEGSASPMHGPNPYPPESLLPGWAAEARSYFAAAAELSRALSRGLALALRLPETFFVDRMRDPVAQLLLLRYPLPPDAVVRKRVGCGEHTDCGFLTLLAQDDVPGLEVRTRGGSSTDSGGAAACGSCDGGGGSSDGDWVPAPPLPGALLVNLGDLAQFWSGGRFRSTPHRVYISEAAAGRARHSCVFFCNCDFDAEVIPVGPSEGGASAPAAAQGRTTAGRYILEKLGLMYT